MVESSITQASPISTQPSPREVVEAYLRVTVDTPDLQQARLHLTKRSMEGGDFQVRAMPAGSTYTMGAEEADELGRRIPVSLKRPASAGGEAEEMTVPMIVVEEEGQWKIDLPATMERLMGGDVMTKIVEGAVDTMLEGLTIVSDAVGKATAQGLSGTLVPAAAKPPAKPARGAKPTAKTPRKSVKKMAKKVVRKVAGRKVKKAAAKKVSKKPAKKASHKPAKKAVRNRAKKTAARKASKKRR
jgi:hypothetical protein